MLNGLRSKGAGNSPIATFLLSVMIPYFGWEYVLILTVLRILGSIAIRYPLSALMKEEDSLWSLIPLGLLASLAAGLATGLGAIPVLFTNRAPERLLDAALPLLDL